MVNSGRRHRLSPVSLSVRKMRRRRSSPAMSRKGAAGWMTGVSTRSAFRAARSSASAGAKAGRLIRGMGGVRSVGRFSCQQGDCGDTPLCHFVTSPPHGGRSVGVLGNAQHQTARLRSTQTPARNHCARAQPISPLAGEMSGRTEGGTPRSRARKILTPAGRDPRPGRRGFRRPWRRDRLRARRSGRRGLRAIRCCP